MKKRRVDLVNVDTHPVNPSSGTHFQNVDVILEVEERADGWNAMIDVGGLKRCLLNLLGTSQCSESYVDILKLRYTGNALKVRGPMRTGSVSLTDRCWRLQFTSEGHVKVKLSCLPRPFSEDDTRHVALISIEDTG